MGGEPGDAGGDLLEDLVRLPESGGGFVSSNPTRPRPPCTEHFYEVSGDSDDPVE